MRDEEPLVLASGNGQENELGGPVENGTDQIGCFQANSGLFEHLAHGGCAGILPLLDATTDREPPGTLGLILIVPHGQQDTSVVVKKEDAGSLPMGVAVRVHRPVECAHTSSVAQRRRTPQTRRVIATAVTGNSIAP